MANVKRILGAGVLVLAAAVSCGAEIDIGDNTRAGFIAGTAAQIGQACTPSDESDPQFANYQLGETVIESGRTECAPGACVVHNYHGRVSCPYGQTEADLSLPPDHPLRCRVPQTSAAAAPVGVEVPVEPAFADRSALDAAYCSCRCAGPDPNANYCQCPVGYSCESIADLIIPNDPSPDVGSYCLKLGTKFNPLKPPHRPCVPGSSPGDPGFCGYQGYNP